MLILSLTINASVIYWLILSKLIFPPCILLKFHFIFLYLLVKRAVFPYYDWYYMNKKKKRPDLLRLHVSMLPAASMLV